jgi:hypothetical protein
MEHRYPAPLRLHRDLADLAAVEAEGEALATGAFNDTVTTASPVYEIA